ncbi:hypothetical protein acsn021_08440 [Anaerocolumna cellulosilytica]|uniref:Aminotransferase class V domain-containing protein n=1 Tax=Anaerocolumna cellulosilytica TaxID=433286 RepID=A0A6S6R109_9FIRM|nr:alanine--glyoxylate aminotransferase family protein [Anaerocolumna cellulosilytica]MBB5194332.1 aspartate aminotransferase-like enzyme [Anaerocolumna cellulosilytica]BCJ93275.1 hypothetical protein acsn021_08440 [Anaerocolumna cellulosilytica]
MLKLMTPGPTQVRENVRLARSREFTNPDLDSQFFDFYKDTCCLLGKLIGTANPVYILSGEGILALEAACASLTEVGDKVLVLNNGVFGEGFADFVRIYGGEPVLYNADFRQEIKIDKLSEFLKENHDFKYATLVQCDTPSGVLNNVNEIGSLLKEYGILTVVDAVSSMFGEELKVDESCIDIACGGSQKVLSAPPGVCFVSVSKEALTCMKERKTPIASYYGNLLNFTCYYEKQWFPYTMPISDIYGISEALRNVAEDKDIIMRHKMIAEGVRHAVRQGGLSLYIKKGFSNTVTAIEVPEGIKAETVVNRMKDKYHILIAGSIGSMSGKVIRIGHMGENANYEDVAKTLKALTAVLLEQGIPVKTDLEEAFLEYVKLKSQPFLFS